MLNFETIFQKQKIFFNSNKTKNIDFRIAQLKKLKGILLENESLLYEAIKKDFSKSEFDTFTTEINFIYQELHYFIKNLKKLSRPKSVIINLVNLPGSSKIYSEPLGTVFVIGAWNYPYQLTLLPVISAIAAGNTCLIKPSELPENTMKVMAKIINENFSEDYLYVIEGGVEETTEVLKFPFDKIFFTGSTKVGKIVYEAAAKNLTPVTLELGGKSPTIVMKSANLEIAVKRIVWGKFLNAGQTCIAPDYILVEENIKEEFLKLLKDRIEQSEYLEASEQYVNIINKKNFERLKKLINPEKIFFGGNTNEQSLYIQPTILTEITWEDAVMQQEIFGPILPIISFTNFDEILLKIKTFDQPLSAYLFSTNADEKTKFIENISFGGGCINDTLMHISNKKLPFGGVGSSGMGNYHGAFGFAAFSHQKSMVMKPFWGENNLRYPPYSQSKKKWLNLFLK